MLLRATHTRRRGAVLALVAVGLIGLITMVALAIDIGMVAVARNQCQNAADAAAMAGARTLSGDSDNNYNYSAVPGNAFKAACANKVFSQNVPGDPTNYTTVNAYTYPTGQLTVA